MTWLLPRLLQALGAALLGFLIGAELRVATGFEGLSLGAGVVAGVGLLLLLDAVRGHRLLSWLRGNQQDSAPRDSGLWGELGYRVERAMRDRDRAVARGRLELEQFLSAIEASPNGVLMLDAQEHILWCNRAAADHFALDPKRDLQQRITNLVRAPAFVAYLQAGRFAEPLVLGNGRGPGTLSIIVREYGEGQRLVLSLDITERLRSEAMRRDFVANVSHEIRTPLTVLSGFIETLHTLPLTAVERDRVLVLMSQQTQRMQTLVADLLTLAQLEGSPRPAPDRWVALDSLLLRIAADAEALSAGRHTLRLKPLTGVELAGIESELLSAVANLVTNAVRYTPDGREVEVAWRLLEDGSGELTVIDTGPGIAREHLPRLTERFYRVDGSRSRETGGTGLGLSIVKHVMQRHGGELMIQSEVGKGSRFRLLFPAARVRQASDSALGDEAAFSNAALSDH
ncbi:phosphate regulon sensor histidine kinase PhoR [Pelomonas aquatica]|jgi:two-component system phosphate regulon sensor histidine kinase PhoR|uniref:Phosphate regulon sensor protein PhoR n=1 Tax=Pelomonas aquatica TaxID=431058 RepID=A0A9X4R395_9BURK|nr:phosphate regulon sensor histidine kinase PhoR [Pelomonas aquatica]MCY4754849.1 phosphate regulon sensor histidine kinase PhoR [Pelomonas aquatica]MDG0861837.1 phosphate regulon sensor histidine kinase PhoR [Pelomonas aquatica]